MSTRGLKLRRGANGLWLFGRELPEAATLDHRPDHEQCDPSWIRGALRSAESLPHGGWYALDAATEIGNKPRRYTLQGRELVVFRDARGIVALPEACPHLGASLACARVQDGKLVCPWHGLKLGREGHRGYRPLEAFDDGVLCWVRAPGVSEPTDRPFLPPRPVRPLSAVVRVEAACEPRDVIANRLDPWHGAHFHPHSFGSLRVVEQDTASITVRVAYRVLGPLAVEVDARFHCSDPRSIVMTIVRGEGEGSVVETHACPLTAGRTAIIEATLATSERRGFRVAHALGTALRPAMSFAARRLWVEDAQYAERLYALRGRATPSAAGPRHAAKGEAQPS